MHYANVVTSDHTACTKVGQTVLEKVCNITFMKICTSFNLQISKIQGGNAVDAAVSSTLCLALTEPHITGIGGGGLMLIHSHRKNTSVVIDFRETAPENARNDR